VLYKNYAAYTTTSITANKSSENRNMDKEKDKSNEGATTDPIALALDKITSRIEKIEASIEAREKAGKVEAASLQSMIKPHADALRTIAGNLANAGIGMQAEVGHVALLHKMADQMEAEAVLGRIPSTYGFYASKEHSNPDKKAEDHSSAEFKEIKASLADLTTLVNDVQKQAFHAAKEPERKTISPAIAHLLAKAGIKPSEEKKLTSEEVDSLLANKNIPVASRIAAKLELKQAGKME
jgi:tetrahydromethanopterin S-methyltransferase subunit B